MCDEAAIVTDRILPNVPIRQYVLSLPYELRGLAATKPDVLTALGRIFAEEIARTTKRLTGVAGAETGAVSFPQRFGGSLTSTSTRSRSTASSKSAGASISRDRLP